MDGWGTNEETIINILTQRRYNTRMSIVSKYDYLYDKDLWEHIKDETSGDFRTALKGLVLTEARFLAEEMRNAMDGAGTNEDTLLLCLMLTIKDHATVQGIKDQYQYIYNGVLEDRIKNEVSSPFEDFLVEVLNRPKFNESEAVSETSITADVSDLTEFIKDKKLKDIALLLTSRSLSHLNRLQEVYYQTARSELYEDLEAISGHHIRDAFVSLLSVASNYYSYCAYELYNAMDGSGTDEGVVTRIIVTRADRDLGNIKTQYDAMFGSSLRQKVIDDTSDDYRSTLLGLIGEE